MSNPIRDAQSLGQSIWYDNVSRGLLSSGELDRLIELGVRGVTSNPTIFERSIGGSADYDEALETLARAGTSIRDIYEALVLADIRAAADALHPIYQDSSGLDGYVSLEVSPALAQDTEGTIDEAKRLFAELGRPNVMIKVPATPQGIPAVRSLISQGVNVNVTLIFSLEMYRQVMEAYIEGLEELARRGGDLSRVASVASFFVSRVDTLVDALLEEKVRHGDPNAQELMGKAAVANAKLAYQSCKEVFGTERFATLEAMGGRLQRPLWASTSTKNPAYSDLLYVEPLIGPNTVNTVPDATLEAMLAHGTAASTLEQGVDDAQADIKALEEAGISMAQVTAKLLADGVKAFADSYDKLLVNIAEKREVLLSQSRDHTAAATKES
ncbi:MAG: talA [Dehalococcoidia bacterium]|nr:talA [Dehalococcoidia bacterium]